MESAALEGGFSNAPVDAAHAFRAVMNAMARPGVISELAGAVPPAPLSVAAGVVLLTLCDPETPVYLAPSRNNEAVRSWITFHTGAPFSSVETAMFAVGHWTELKSRGFTVGTPAYPDRSATLIVELERLMPEGATLRGPGIRDTTALSLPEVEAFQSNARLFPLGLDHLFTCGNRLAGLPRTTKVS
ncbi:phosphonate C-P lyase system protein PhnH [Algicella marina]|uniref:Phosphonate C-P lyase system protein PhnH n=1 Tax=Algicella marina TaxID=2683284 RepID=A0A6P1T1J1_9RHOB|nr:phosphonate C-P lyase system protein PhnH [Algicella marina]QHQ35680.1 phosphonate C-P lyase system protein PhnH [Algicella marina]